MEKKERAKGKKKAISKRTSRKNIATRISHDKNFLVVGLGASAGGVKALQEFFATMPANSGMAFVAILHLSPEHESSLPQILQAQTSMKITQVTETVKVEPNNVYVIPPNVQLEMMDGVIRPSTAKRSLGYRVAIDVFFRTLAEAYGKNAVCVVLSGTGSDGTLGLKRIKESNGFAIVQAPDDAEFDSMPRSAIDTQLADWVLPVKQMPEKLIHFRESSERLHLTKGGDAKQIAEEINAEESLREILTVLRVRTGHDFSNYKTPTLIRRIARHLQIHELEDIPSYLEILRNNPNEVQSLLKNLLINVTNFFRDAPAFEALEAEIIPKIFDGKTGKDTIRVWSAGCASGEEAYSLAMILQEYTDRLSDPPKFQVFASDVDDEAIAEARGARYPEAIEADVSQERLKRFFTKEGKYYFIKKELRESVLFAPHNILRDPPFSRLDLIVCRNLLIYLNRDTQEKVFQIFHFALKADGFLFLGSAESTDSSLNLFAPIEKKHRLYSRLNATLSNKYLPAMPVIGRWEVRVPENRPVNVPDHAATLSEIHYRLLEDYAPSSVLVNQEFDIVYLSGEAGKFLRFAKGEPSNNLLKMVHPELLPDLRAALYAAQREHKSAEFSNLRMTAAGGEEITVDLIVRAIDVTDEARDYLLVIFEEHAAGGGGGKTAPRSSKNRREPEQITDKTEVMETVVTRLEEDLQRTREHLRLTGEQHETALEEHRAANEELQATIEELRSASEELETSKEELQSVNEELTTVNHELKEKIDETSRINSDLQNLMAATDIATVFLDKELRIKRYTPPVEELFNITRADIGRPLEHFTHKLRYENLAVEAKQVLRSLKSVEREIESADDRFYLARFLPYRTIDDRIDGIVLHFIDITSRKRAEEDLRESEMRRHYALEAANVGTFLYHPQEDRGEPDERMLELFGLKKSDTLNLAAALDKMIHPDDREYYRTEVAKAVDPNGDGKLYAEIRVVHPNESVHWVAVTAQVVFDGEPAQAVRMYGTAADITERKLSEERQAFLLKLGDALRQLASSLDIEAAVTRLTLEHFGADRCYYCTIENGNAIARKDAVRGDLPSVAGIYPLHDFAIFRSAIEAGKPYAVPDVHTTDTLDEGLRQICLQLSIVSYVIVPVIKQGVAVGLFCLVQSVPREWTAMEMELAAETAERTWAAIERARAEESLRRSEGRLRALFESIDEGFSEMQVILDEEGHVVDWLHLALNGNFSRVTGIPDITGRLASEVFPNLEGEWFRRMDLAYRTGEPQRFETELTELGRWFDNYITRLGGADDNRVFGVFGDITERKRREQQQEFLLKFSDVLRTLPDKETIEETGLRLLAEFLRLDRAYVFVLYPPEDRAVVRAEQRKENLASLLGEVRMSDFPETVRQIEDQTLVFNDIDTDARLSDLNRTSLAAANLQAFVCTSVREGERNVIWSLAAASATPRAWTEGEVELIETVGERMWAAVERARAEEALRKSEERLRLATEAAKAYSWEYDVKTETYKFSANAAKVLGIAKKNLPRTIEDTFALVHPDDKRLVEKTLKTAIRTGEGFTLDFRTVTQRGKIIWLGVQTLVVKDEKGKSSRVVGIAQNITERKMAEERLRESEERMRIAIEAGELATWEWDILAGKVMWNEQHFTIFGMKPTPNKSMKPEDFFYHVHPDDRDWVGERLQESVRKKTPFDAEFRALIEKDGVRWMDGYGRVTETDKRGQATKMSGVMFDITERKRAEEALRKSEEQLQMVLESTKDYAIITFDLKGFITRWNSGAERIFGYTEKEAVGGHSTFLFTPEDQMQKIPETEMKTALEKGRAEDERWHVHKNGSRFYASGVMQPLKDGKIEGFVKIARDQTERIQTETALREKETLEKLVKAQEEERKRIARDLHDELGQQLTALRIKLDAVTRNQKEPMLLNQLHEIQDIARSIDDGVDFLAWELRPTTLDDLGLTAALDNYIKQWSRYAGVKAELTISNLKRTRFASEVETCLYRIVQEALNNTHKHAEATNVDIILKRRDDLLILIIEDNGKGFNRKNKMNRQKGMGLTGMQERAALVGGTLEIESAPKQGTTIFVRLPFSAVKDKKND